MMREHFGPGADGDAADLAPRTRFNTGDGIRMALALGADMSGDWNGMHIEPVDPRANNSAPVVLVYPYGIVVDKTGRRFFDEGAGLVHETWETFSRHAAFRRAGPQGLRDPRPAAATTSPDWQRAMRSEVPPSRRRTLRELAGKIGVDAGSLADDGRGLQRGLHRRSADRSTPRTATGSPRRRACSRRSRTGRAPSSSRRFSPGR